MLLRIIAIVFLIITAVAGSVNAAVISEIDATRSEYDKVILRENGKPFFWNQVQLRHDTLEMPYFDNPNIQGDNSIELAFQKAYDMGYRLVTLPIRWDCIEPDYLETPADDSYVNSVSPSSNYGSENSLCIRNNGSNDTKIGYIKFPLNGSSYAGNYGAAKLRLYARCATFNVDKPFDQNDYKLKIYKVPNNSWAENTLNYSNAPVKGELIGQIDVESASYWYEIDVSDYIEDCLEGSLSYVSFAVETNVVSPNLEMKIESSEGVKEPQLVISTQRQYESQLDFSVVEDLMDLAYSKNLKIEFVFSSANGCGVSRYVPYYMIGTGTYNPYMRAKKSNDMDFYLPRPYGGIYLTCMTHQANVDREEHILRKLVEHIADYDDTNNYNNVVVGFQVSNEPFIGKMYAATPGDEGLIGENAETGYDRRCYCQSCDEKWEEWGFPVDAYGNPYETEENLLEFRKRVVAFYLNEVAKGVKFNSSGSASEYSIWTRVNFWTNNSRSDCANVEEIKQYAENMDFIGPDPYLRELDKLYEIGHTTFHGDNFGIDYSISNNFPYAPENFGGMALMGLIH